jgi:histidinol-phosphate aminotransferase
MQPQPRPVYEVATTMTVPAFDPVSLLRPDIAAMEAYTPVLPFEVLSRQLGREPEDIVKLDANENPYGPSPRVIEALTMFRWYHIYPDPQQEALRAALADYVGVPAGFILPGHGADELIDYLCRLFLLPGDAIINCPPTFGMYGFDARLSGGRVVDVPRQEDFSLDLEAIAEAVRRVRPKLLFLTSPNNPDGSLIPPEALRRLLALPVMVVVDEAYIEFAGREYSVASWVPETPNLVVLRTFSKWAGLAGLRLGYGIFPAAILAHLWKFKQPYNVNVAATVAGLASLADVACLQERVARLVAERERLIVELGRFPGLRPLPSRANFVLCRVEGIPAVELHRRLRERGVLVRYYDKPGLRNCIRVSAGRPQDTDRLLAALAEALEA